MRKATGGPVRRRTQSDRRCQTETHKWLRTRTQDKVSISEILNRLGNFRLAKVTPEGHDIAKCNGCRHYLTIVSEVREKVTKYFHGLCLDCMRQSKTETKKSWADCWIVVRGRLKITSLTMGMPHGTIASWPLGTLEQCRNRRDVLVLESFGSMAGTFAISL